MGKSELCTIFSLALLSKTLTDDRKFPDAGLTDIWTLYFIFMNITFTCVSWKGSSSVFYRPRVRGSQLQVWAVQTIFWKCIAVHGMVSYWRGHPFTVLNVYSFWSCPVGPLCAPVGRLSGVQNKICSPACVVQGWQTVQRRDLVDFPDFHWMRWGGNCALCVFEKVLWLLVHLVGLKISFLQADTCLQIAEGGHFDVSCALSKKTF